MKKRNDFAALIAATTTQLVAFVLLSATSMSAQEDVTGNIVDLEAYTVIGTQLQNQRVIDARRETSAFVIDAVTTDDIGRLPDFNIGEALQRLPGIGIANDQAEARFVTIRALNAEYNYTTVDGVSIAVPDRNGRRVFMDVMPASLAERIDVVKTFTPNHEGAAIGGIINIRTASAFDYAPNSLKVSAEIGKYSNDEGYRDVGPSGSGEIFYSTLFGEKDKFGLVVTSNYYKRDSVIPQTEWGSSRYFYDASGADAGQPLDPPYPGTGWAVPAERRGYWYHNDRTRYGFTGKLQFKPSDTHEYFIRAFWNTATDDEARQTDLLRHSGKGQLVDQTEKSGTILSANSLRQAHYLGQFDFERTVWAITGGADLEFANGGTLSLRANYSGSNFRNPEHWHEWRMAGDNDGDGVDDNAFSYRRDGNVYLFELLDPEANRNFANFKAERRQFDNRSLDEDIYELKADWSDDIGGGEWGYGVGVSYRKIDRTFDEERSRYLRTASNVYTMAAANVLNTDVNLQPPGFTGNQSLVVIDPDRANANWDAHYSANPDQWRFDEMINNDNNRDYRIVEEVMAAYAMMNRTTEKSNLIFGLRFEDTSTEGYGRRNVRGTGWTDTSNEGGYSDLLPSLNYSYEISNDKLLRIAASRTFGRAAFNKFAPVGESFNPDSLTLSRPNPDLKPRYSNNLDIGFDWYLDSGKGLVAVNFFYKQVEGEIFTASQDAAIDIDGTQTLVTVTQPTNLGDNTNVYGVELQYIRNLEFIYEGLALSVNATFLSTDFTIPMNDGSTHQLHTMIEQPNETYNLALSYDNATFSAKLAFTYQSQRASFRVRTDNEYRNRYDTEDKSIDFKATYRLNDNWALTFNAWNLTEEGRGEVLGFDQELPIVEADFGRAFFVGFSYQN